MKNKILIKIYVIRDFVYIFIYYNIFYSYSTLLTINGLDLVSASISAAATAISNVGPGLGDTIGPNGTFRNF